jgi:basic membrane lipoprotein Med (substrate-binding protein (PBP1-ABC) superfamily)
MVPRETGPERAYSPLLLVEILHLVVQAIHLCIDLFLLEDALADQEGRQAVQQDPVLDDHLLDLLVFVLEIFAVVLLDIVSHASSKRQPDVYHWPPAAGNRKIRATMKRALLAFAFLLAACQQQETTTPATPATARSAAPFRIGLLTPGSINDGGWNAIAYEGLQRAKTELGAEVSHQETKTPGEFEEGFRSYGAKGYDLAFGHGFEFLDPALKLGPQYPKTVFITTSGNRTAANVAPMVFELEQATYLLGVIAARESKTGKAGLVGGIKLPSIDSTFLAFKAGAHSVNPKFEVREIYTGNFDDLGAAKVATLSLINAGCDFIFHQANEAGRGVFQACSERKVRCFGSNKNQNDLAPDVIVASAVLDVPSAFLHMAKLVRDKQFKPQVYMLGMNEGIVSLVWNDALKAQIAPATVAEVERLEKDIRAGTLKVPRGF